MPTQVGLPQIFGNTVSAQEGFQLYALEGVICLSYTDSGCWLGLKDSHGHPEVGHRGLTAVGVEPRARLPVFQTVMLLLENMAGWEGGTWRSLVPIAVPPIYALRHSSEFIWEGPAGIWKLSAKVMSGSPTEGGHQPSLGLGPRSGFLVFLCHLFPPSWIYTAFLLSSKALAWVIPALWKLREQGLLPQSLMPMGIIVSGSVSKKFNTK